MRKATVEAGKMTDELESIIVDVEKLTEVESIKWKI